jgi:hypothetical protein
VASSFRKTTKTSAVVAPVTIGFSPSMTSICPSRRTVDEKANGSATSEYAKAPNSSPLAIGRT